MTDDVITGHAVEEEEPAVDPVVQAARDAVSEAFKEGLASAEKAILEARKAVKDAQGANVPLIHDSRIGDFIDDAWTVPRLLELALPDASKTRDIPGMNGEELGEFPFFVTDQELQLVRDAAMDFIKLLEELSEALMEILEQALEDDEEGIIGDSIFLKEQFKDAEIQATARHFTRRHFSSEKAQNDLKNQLRAACLDQTSDPDSKIGRKAQQLVHSVNDLIIDMGTRDQVKKACEFKVTPIGDKKVIKFLKEAKEQEAKEVEAKLQEESTSAAADFGVPPEMQRKSKVARTMQ